MVIKMDDGEEEMLQENIQEYVEDQNKLVTYKYLSYNLNIHVNKAKTILEKYCQSHCNDLDVVYIVGGRKKGADLPCYDFKLVGRSDLEDIKKEYETMTTCHIYGIKKGEIKDSLGLYGNDYDTVHESLNSANQWSSIQCKDAVPTETRPIEVKTAPVLTEVDRNKMQNGLKEQVKKSESKPAPIVSKESKKPSKPAGKEITAASFFGKKASGKTAGKSSTDTSDENKVKESVKSATVADAKKIDDKKDEAKSSTKKDEAKDSSKKDEGKATNSLSMAFTKSKPKKEKPEKTEEKEVEKKADYTLKDSPKEDSKRKNVQVEAKAKVETKKAQQEKRKAVESGSESEDDFEQFLSKSKEPVTKENVALQKEEEELEKDEKFLADDEDDESEDEESSARLRYHQQMAEEMEGEEILPPTPQNDKMKSKVKKRKMNDDESGSSKVKNKKTEDSSTDSNKDDSGSSKKKNKKLEDSNNNSNKDDSKKVKEKKPKEKEANKSEKSTPSLPKPSVIAAPSKKPGEKRRGRRLVTKSKQFMNEEGFMVTEKVKEYESFSEESDSELMQKDEKDIPAEKVAAVQAKKASAELQKNIKQQSKKPKTQASLTSFFKKK